MSFEEGLRRLMNEVGNDAASAFGMGGILASALHGGQQPVRDQRSLIQPEYRSYFDEGFQVRRDELLGSDIGDDPDLAWNTDYKDGLASSKKMYSMDGRRMVPQTSRARFAHMAFHYEAGFQAGYSEGTQRSFAQSEYDHQESMRYQSEADADRREQARRDERRLREITRTPHDWDG